MPSTFVHVCAPDWRGAQVLCHEPHPDKFVSIAVARDLQPEVLCPDCCCALRRYPLALTTFQADLGHTPTSRA